MTERLGKRVSRSITFYPTPEDQDLLEELDRRAAAQMLTFSELCKIALRHFVEIPCPFVLADREVQQQVEAELTAQGVSFSDWVKQKLSAAPVPTSNLEQRVQRLEQVITELQQRPVPLSQAEIEQLIRQHLTPMAPETEKIEKAPPPPPPPPPKPTPDPLIAELGALLVEDF